MELFNVHVHTINVRWGKSFRVRRWKNLLRENSQRWYWPINWYNWYTGRPRSYRKYIQQITQPSQYGYAKLQYRFAVTSGSPSTIIWPIESFIFFTTATIEKKYWVNQKSVFYLQTLRKYSDTKLLLCSLKWLQGYILCILIITPPPPFEIHFFIDVPSVQEVVTHFIL